MARENSALEICQPFVEEQTLLDTNCSGGVKLNMKRMVKILVWWIVLFASIAAYAQDKKPIIREERDVIVDGVTERWILRWVKPPTPVCGPDDEYWDTCPCSGFAFGERGDLELVRRRPGQNDEVFSLTPLFKNESYDLPAANGSPEAVLRRWDTHKGDFEAENSPGFAARVGARPASEVLHFADYDHDGRATEFLLQIGTLPCGKRMCVAVGVSQKNLRLHAFGSVANPTKPLVLQDWEWEALSKAKGLVKVVDWRCGDHGSEVETELELKAEKGVIHATRKEYTCTESGKRGKLVKEEAF